MNQSNDPWSQPLKIDDKCVHLVCCGPHGRRKLSNTIFARVLATVHGHCGREQRTDPSAGIDCNFSGSGSRSECTCTNSRHFWLSCAKASMNSTIGWKWAEISVCSVRPVVNVRMVVTSDTCRKMAILARDHGDHVRQAACAQRLAPIVPSLPTFPWDVLPGMSNVLYSSNDSVTGHLTARHKKRRRTVA